MTSDDSPYTVDPWSRFVSYCSLVVAVGALVWGLFGFGTLSNWGESSAGKSLESATIEARYKKEVEQRNQRDEEIRDQWKQQQAEQLTSFTNTANELLRKHQQLVNLQAGNVAAASYAALTEETEAGGTAGEEETAVEDTDTDLASGKSRPLPIKPAEGSVDDNTEDRRIEDKVRKPLLAYVRESLKPEDGADTTLLTIGNRGDSPARLERVEFTPTFEDESIFEVDSAAPLLATEDGLDVLSIVFSAEDNLASAEGKHGVYARDLSGAHVVPAASNVRLRLVVANSKHAGWGFQGTVKLDYDGLEPLTIEDARLVFVEADDTESP